MKLKGKIINWNDQKRFGFIVPDEGGDNVFAHISDFKDKLEGSLNDKRVSYEVSKDKRGRVCAVNVEFTNAIYKTGARKILILLALFFLGLMVLLCKATDYPSEVLYGYLFMSTVTFLAYWADKDAAERRRWRVKSSLLHILAVIGGWPGAMLARAILNHKIAKARHRIQFWITVLVNLLLLSLTFSDWGRGFVDTAAEQIRTFFGG